jgi:transposase-like protein
MRRQCAETNAAIITAEKTTISDAAKIHGIARSTLRRALRRAGFAARHPGELRGPKPSQPKHVTDYWLDK